MTRISVDEAARRLGVGKQVIRCGVLDRSIPIGVTVKGPTGRRHTFLIYEEFLKKFEEEHTK